MRPLEAAKKIKSLGVQEWIKGVPLKRAGTAKDIAGLVTFLASDDAAYITGQSVNVDGGLVMS